MMPFHPKYPSCITAVSIYCAFPAIRTTAVANPLLLGKKTVHSAAGQLARTVENESSQLGS